MYKIYYVLVLFILSCQNKSKDATIDNHIIEKKQLVVDSFVFDNVGLLDSVQQKYFANKLSNYYHENHIAVLCVITKTIEPFEDEMDYGDFIIRMYKEEYENLVVIIMFTDDRRVIIKTDRETQKNYSDSRCRQILKEFVIPRFKKEEYFEGLESGINQLIDNK